MPTGRFGHLYAASRRTTQWRPFIRTWEHFSTLWPTRDDPFSRAMNAASKAVVTHREIDPDVWAGSVSVDGPLVTWVRDTVPTTDVVVIGSGSVDEYRLLVFPTAAGSGRRLFPAMQRLELASAEQVGPAALGILTPVRA